MKIEREKVYVAIGTEGYDGFSTLQWVLRKWDNHGIKVVILHVENDAVCKDYVYTPLGKLRSSSVNEEKLQILDKNEESKRDRILAQYIALCGCGKVEAEVMKVERKEETLHNEMVEAISNLGISKLVMSLAFMKASSPKSRSGVSGAFYVVRNKPSWCEVFVICEGERIFLKQENEEGSVMLRKRSHSMKNWLWRMFPETSGNSNLDHELEKCSEEMKQYAEELMSLHQLEGEIVVGGGNNSIDLCIPQNMNAADRALVCQGRIQDARDMIQMNRKQANVAKERRAKARRAIAMCNARAEELQTSLHMETVKKVELSRMLDATKEEIVELQSDLQERRSKLNSIVQHQEELSQKLHRSSSTRARVELQLEKAVETRADMVKEIEELRKQKNVLHRRIEFCKEKDAIAKVSRTISFGFDFREFSAAEIIAATEDFSERFRLKSKKNVYKGRINHISVAVKKHNPVDERSIEAFKSKVKLHSHMQHPNILAMIGFCSELSCIVYEYMHNGTLHDALFSTARNRQENQTLTWHARIRIAAEICSTLGFLHEVKPNPIIHGSLKPSNILLDRFNVAKIYGLQDPRSCEKPDITSDIRAFGNLVLQLLTGNHWSTTMETAVLIENLDYTAGEWPMDLASELSCIAMRCLSANFIAGESASDTLLVREINDVKRRGDQLVGKGKLPVPDEEAARAEESSNVPGAFLCPIYRDVMRNPHLAADGFSYEMEAIDQWLKTGHDTSPMTNLRLKHKLLVPNHTLRSLIEDWSNKRPTEGAS